MTGRIRIIGGKWRNRKLDVIDAEGLRPTPDRVRETLFNWLQSSIEGATCLDLYAGTGALGFEALSRGAAGVTMVDSNPVVVKVLKHLAEKLGADAQIVCANAEQWISQQTDHYDIIFLDPPFSEGRLEGIIALILEHSCLKQGGLLYVETDHEFNYADSRLCPVKTGKAGKVHFLLQQYSERNI